MPACIPAGQSASIPLRGLDGLTFRGAEGLAGVAVIAGGVIDIVRRATGQHRKTQVVGIVADLGIIGLGFWIFSRSGETVSDLITGVEGSSIIQVVGL